MSTIKTKSGRSLVVTKVAPQPVASLQEKVVRAIHTLNAAELRGLTSEMRGVDFIMSYDFQVHSTSSLMDHGGKRMQGPPLCIMLHQIKMFEISIVQLIPELLGVIVRDWDKDPNAEFNVNESWPTHPRVACRDMRCSAMAWLMLVRHVSEGAINSANLQCCITTLISLGADVRLPFKLNYINNGKWPQPAMQNGLSLPFIALRSLESLECAERLLKGGAQFLPTDPAPLCIAMREFQVDAAIGFFYRNRELITEGDVLKMDTSGATAMHIFISNPTRDARVAVELLDMMLSMGFSPKTRLRDGTTCIDFAEECVSAYNTTPAKKAIYDRLKAVQLAHDREMAVAAERVVRDAPIPQEIIKSIWDRLEYADVTMEHARRAAERVRQPV